MKILTQLCSAFNATEPAIQFHSSQELIYYVQLASLLYIDCKCFLSGQYVVRRMTTTWELNTLAESDRTPDKVQIFMSKMPSSWQNPMFEHLLESSRWDDSNKWSNIVFGEEMTHVESIEVHFTHIIWCSEWVAMETSWFWELPKDARVASNGFIHYKVSAFQICKDIFYAPQCKVHRDPARTKKWPCRSEKDLSRSDTEYVDFSIFFRYVRVGWKLNMSSMCRTYSQSLRHSCKGDME